MKQQTPYTEWYKKDGKDYVRVVHKSMNPLAPMALVDMDSSTRMKFGNGSPFYKDIRTVDFENKLAY